MKKMLLSLTLDPDAKPLVGNEPVSIVSSVSSLAAIRLVSATVATGANTNNFLRSHCRLASLSVTE